MVPLGNSTLGTLNCMAEERQGIKATKPQPIVSTRRISAISSAEFTPMLFLSFTFPQTSLYKVAAQSVASNYLLQVTRSSCLMFQQRSGKRVSKTIPKCWHVGCCHYGNTSSSVTILNQCDFAPALKRGRAMSGQIRSDLHVRICGSGFQIPADRFEQQQQQLLQKTEQKGTLRLITTKGCYMHHPS